MTDPGPAAPSPYPVLPGQGAPDQNAPAPPPGPGVSPPFVAPPVEGRDLRMWIGLGVGALALLICCGGGGAAVVGLVVTGTQAVREQARAVTGDYYKAIADKRYDKAYGLLCEAEQRRESRPDFERRLTDEPGVASYRVGEPELSNEVVVPVRVTFDGGGQGTQRVTLVQDRRTGSLEVCGVS